MSQLILCQNVLSSSTICRVLNDSLLTMSLAAVVLSSWYACRSFNDILLGFLGYIQVRLLSQVGGNDASDTARRVMKKLMTRRLALQFNWKGRGEKRGFSKMNLWPVVTGMTITC